MQTNDTCSSMIQKPLPKTPIAKMIARSNIMRSSEVKCSTVYRAVSNECVEARFQLPARKATRYRLLLRSVRMLWRRGSITGARPLVPTFLHLD